MEVSNHHTDAHLTVLLSEGDHLAFEVIYRRYASQLLHLARKTIASKEDSEEIIHDVFVSLWERRESLHILSLKYYLIKAVQFKVIRYIQHNKVKMKYAEHYRLFEAAYDSIEKEERTPEAIHEMLLKSIGSLPDRCQTAVKLRLLENLTNGEIADRMNIAKKTVEVYMLKAYTHFRASYNKIYNTQ